jgi:hypothetical protein
VADAVSPKRGIGAPLLVVHVGGAMLLRLLGA